MTTTENALLNKMSNLIWEKVERRMNASLKNLENRLGDDGGRNSRSAQERGYGKGFSLFNDVNGEEELESTFWEPEDRDHGDRSPEIPKFNRFRPKRDMDIYYNNEGWVDLDVVDVE